MGINTFPVTTVTTAKTYCPNTYKYPNNREIRSKNKHQKSSAGRKGKSVPLPSKMEMRWLSHYMRWKDTVGGHRSSTVRTKNL